MDYETVSCTEMLLAGIQTRASNDDPSKIGELWGRFMSDEAVARLDKLDPDPVAVYCDYDGDHTQPYTFFLGCPLSLDPRPDIGLIAHLGISKVLSQC